MSTMWVQFPAIRSFHSNQLVVFCRGKPVRDRVLVVALRNPTGRVEGFG